MLDRKTILNNKLKIKLEQARIHYNAGRSIDYQYTCAQIAEIEAELKEMGE